MSKLGKAIDAALTGNVRASRDLKLNYLHINMDSRLDPRMLSKEIKLSAKLESTKWIEDTLADKPGGWGEVCRDIKRSMIEEVFGEFRPMLIEMRSALYDEDNVRLRTLMAEMENIMFHEGL